MQKFENIRNFVIISHIDHGKSTLADRFLELTGTVPKQKMHPQYLDMMDLEKEKGITIKLQPVRMVYRCLKPDVTHNTQRRVLNRSFILNLIDTPGHIDFSYEVSRSLAAVEGAILLVDATQGVQAQTLANLYLAVEQKLKIIPVINKIDLPTAQIEETTREIIEVFNSLKIILSAKDILKISAKTGENVEDVLETVIEKINPPSQNIGLPLRALIFDSTYDPYKGVIAFVRIVDGEIRKGEQILAIASGAESEALEVGFFKPELIPRDSLAAGEIGYIATGLKNVSLCRVGDTITKLKVKSPAFAKASTDRQKLKVIPLAGYKEPKPMVFASLYPANPAPGSGPGRGAGPAEDADFDCLKDALNKLKLSDASLFFEAETSAALGRGFKCGFLGMLHMEIVIERLRREYKLKLVVTSPNVVYQIKERTGQTKNIYRAQDFPDKNLIEEIRESWVKLEIITPNKFLGAVMNLLETTGGVYKNTRVLGADRVVVEYEAPLREIVIKRANQAGPFYDLLKGATSGFASMNYELLDWRPADLLKLDILVASEKVEALAKIVPEERAFEEGRATVKKLKEVIPSQLFAVTLQAAIGGKIIARETIRARRKDVTGYLYGGDYTRKRKLLEKQKRGKAKLKKLGRVNIPAEVYLKMLGR